MKNKIRLNAIAMVIALLTGTLAALAEKEWFTSHTLVETILIIAPLLYFTMKYAASRIISKYQQPGYYPAKGTRWLDDLITATSFQVILPLCLDFGYACLILFIVKLINPANLSLLAGWAYGIWKFNEDHIDSPLKTLIVILSLLTLFKILSLKYLKKFKSTLKYMKLPLKFIAILILFMNVDKGTIVKTLEWKLSAEAPELKEGEIPTFNAAQKENIQKIIDAYVDVMIQEIAKEKISVPPLADSVPANVFFSTIDEIILDNTKEPSIKDDLYIGKGTPPDNRQLAGDKLSEADQSTLKNFFEASYTANNEGSTAAINLSNDSRAVADAPEKQESFLKILLDEKTELVEKELSSSHEIMRELLGDYIIDKILLDPLKHGIAFKSFANDKIFDLFKEKALDGFAYMMQKAKSAALKRGDIRMVAEALKTAVNVRGQNIMDHIVIVKQLFTNFANDYRTALKIKTNFYNTGDKSATQIEQFLELFPNDPNHELYENVLVIKKVEADGSGYEKIDLSYWKKLKSQYPDGAEKQNLEELITKLEKNRDIVLANDAKTSDAWIKLRQKYPEFAEDPTVIKNINIYREQESAEAAERVGTSAAWDTFLEKYPNSSIAPEVISSLRQGEVYHFPVGSSESAIAESARSFSPIIRESSGFWEDFFRLFGHVRI